MRTTYQAKCCSAEQAASLVASHTRLMISHGVSQPPALLHAIANRVKAKELQDISIYYIHAEPALSESLLQYDLMDQVHVYSGFFGRYDKRLLSEGEQHGRKVVTFQPNHLSQYPKMVREVIQPQVFVVTVSAMDESGYFSLGTNADYAMASIETADIVLAEVNANMPYTYGNNCVHVTQLDAIVENTTAMHEVKPRQPRPEEETIARTIVELIPDGAALQMGASGVSYALCQLLQNHKDLGLHTEFLSTAMMPLIESGVINGRRKNFNPDRHIFTLCYGNRELYQFMDRHPAIEAHPSDYVNLPKNIAKNDNMHAINSVIEMDLWGQSSAEVMAWRQFTGPGGQNDYMRGAQRSRGGKAILAFCSTAKDGEVSRIVPKVNGMLTNSRLDVQWVVTEYGAENLFGMTTSERARAMINLAHPKFRKQLHDDAVALKLFPPS